MIFFHIGGEEEEDLEDETIGSLEPPPPMATLVEASMVVEVVEAMTGGTERSAASLRLDCVVLAISSILFNT